MNGWNRLFVVVAVIWMPVAPFLFVSESNKPAYAMSLACNRIAYDSYVSEKLNPDFDRYNAEQAKCFEAFNRRFVSLGMTLDGMMGTGNWELGSAAWCWSLIPLALLWIIVWGIARIVLWIVAGFRGPNLGAPVRQRRAHDTE